MRIATLLFTYHRSYHTKQVLSSLKNNTILPEKLYVFQDGLKCGENDCEWKKVNKLIHDIDWCAKEVIISECNRGLADSIVSGVNYAFGDYDAVIVLEDDCVTAPGFMRFMKQCLEKYENNESVHSVSGYSWPIGVGKDEYDIYGCGRISSWGWGTWKDRWSRYRRDADILNRMRADQGKSKRLATWGSDLEDMLLGAIAGRCDSWAVYWALNVIESGGICINPYISLIKNIGWDGTGTNTPRLDNMNNSSLDNQVKEYIFPDNVTVLDTVRTAFRKLFGSSTALALEDVAKENILVYGIGNFYLQNEDAVIETYNIQAFVDQKKQGWFAGKKIIRMDQIRQYKYDKILVMVQSIQECINIARNLILQGVCCNQIILGHNLYGYYSNDFDKIKVLLDGKLSVTVGDISLKVGSEDEFNNVYEVLVRKIYQYDLNDGREDIVIDVGMNIGDTALYFLNCKNTKKVYAYEPFLQTYLIAKENLNGYIQHPDKIEIFQYGISKKNDRRKIGFNSDMSCGQSTIADVRKSAYNTYSSLGLAYPENETEELIEVRDAMEVFRDIILRHPDCNIVLKMNCEGEEYGIIERLSEGGLLERITFIMLEWHYHYKGKENIIAYLKDAGFSYWCNDKDDNMGMIYAIHA